MIQHMDNKETFILTIHSFVDVITNSSTELFMLDTEKSVDVVRDIVKEMEKQYPPEYNGYCFVNIVDEWEIKEAFGYIDEDEAIEYLRAMGYTVIKPETKPQPKYIKISCERGCMDDDLRDFINNTFTVVYHTTEA